MRDEADQYSCGQGQHLQKPQGRNELGGLETYQVATAVNQAAGERGVRTAGVCPEMGGGAGARQGPGFGALLLVWAW